MLTLLTAAFITALGLWLWVQYIKPSQDLRRALHQLAQGQPVSDLSLAQPPGIDTIAADLAAINERLNDLHRRITDEGFSLRVMLAGMVEGVIILDRNESIQLANDAIFKMFEFKRSPIGKSQMEVFQNVPLRAAIEDTLSSGAPNKLTIQIQIFREGKPVPRFFEVSSVALDPGNTGSPTGVIAVFHDISELKMLESVRRELIANVSHELRTPLSIINGYIETLLEGAVEETDLARRFLNTMQKHGNRLNLLIEDLFTISKLESRSPDLNLEKVQLRQILQSVVDRLEQQFTSRSATMEIVAPDDIPPIEADSHRMDQVFFNLVDNALKYCGRSNAHIRVELRQDDDHVYTSITDNGPGIPHEDQPQIFERFYRVFKDRSRDAGGTGLGLSIVKHVIMAHGGEVGLKSEPGEGSTFWFRIPITQPALEVDPNTAV